MRNDTTTKKLTDCDDEITVVITCVVDSNGTIKTARELDNDGMTYDPGDWRYAMRMAREFVQANNAR